MAALTSAAPRPLRLRVSGRGVAGTAVLLVLAWIVLAPLFIVVLRSFQTVAPGRPATFTLATWQAALSDRRLLGSVWNTIQLIVVWEGIAFAAGIPLTWLITRSDLPLARHLESLFWIAIFLPALPITLGWVLLLDPQYGLLNQLATWTGLFAHGPFNIYSFGGILWAHLASSAVAIKVVLLAPAFRNLDSSLEEASTVAGSGRLNTLRRIIVPVLLPNMMIVGLLSIINALQSFEVERVLGPPFNFYTFATLVYARTQNIPPDLESATALSTIVLGLILPLVILHQWVIERRQYTTVSGQFRAAAASLRGWRWPVFAVVLATALTVTVVPLILLVTGTFMKLFGFFNIAHPWTLDQWRRVVTDPIFLTAFRNTWVLGLSVAVLGVILFTAIAYVTVRLQYRARGAVDFMSWLPSTMPGIILGLGLLWLFLTTPVLRPLYGSMLVLILGLFIAHMTLGIQLVKAGLLQIGRELEEAARVAGGNWWHAVWHVVVPLVTPLLVMVGSLTFLATANDVGTVALLSTDGTTVPLAYLQLNWLILSRYESAAVVGVIIAGITIPVALVTRAVAYRIGLQDAAQMNR